MVSAGTTTATGLTANTTYTFKAYSDNCSTELTNDSTDATFLTKPAQPTQPTATAGAGSGKLTLTSSVSGSGTITRWQYQQKGENDTGYGSWTDISGSNNTTLAHTVTGLTNDTEYTFKVRARKAMGAGPASSASAAAEPKNKTLTATTVTTNSLKLTIASHSGSWYYKYTTPTGGTCSSAGSGSSTTVSSLVANTSYTFKAYSDSDCDTELAAASTFVTPPGTPPRLYLQERPSSIRIRWQAPAGATKVRIQVGSSDGNWNTTNSYDIPSNNRLTIAPL